MSVVGKSVIITGASRGIGAAAARAFAAAGAKVLLSARSGDAIKALADEIGAIALAGDVADPAYAKACVDMAVAEHGGLDVFIANAGLLDPIARIEDADLDGWAQVLDVNVNGVLYAMHHALRAMKPKGGTFITVGSGAATSALEGWAHYSASKAAVHHLNRCLHAEEAANGIRALVMSPGTVATYMQETIRASGINPVSDIPWEDHASPDLPARLLVWMCSPAADPWLGEVVALRDPEVRALAGLS